MSEKRLTTTIIVSLFAIVIASPLFYLKQSVYPYISTKTALFQILVEFAFFLWLALAIGKKEYRPKWSYLLKALALFLGILFVASLLGVDRWRSFWSTQERMTGVFFFLHLGMLFFVLTSLSHRIPWRKLFFASIVTASAVSILALIQLKIPNLLLNEPIGQRPGATFGNPTFLAGYLTFNVFLGLYLWAKGKERNALWSSAVVLGTAINLAAIFNTQTRGDILGLGAGFVALLIFFAIRPPETNIPALRRRWLYGGVVIALVCFGVIFWATRANPFWQNVPGIRRFADISLENRTLAPRLYAMRAAWEGFLEKPLMGWGWENFNIVFNKHYDPKLLELNYQETRFDKPHNVFLEYLVAGGMPLFLGYLLFLGALGLALFRAKDPFLKEIFGAAFIAYLVRSIFVFDTLGPLLMFFLLAAFVDREYRIAGGKIESEKAVVGQSHLGILFSCAVVLAFIPIYFVNMRTLFAVYHQYWGFINFVNNKPQLAIQNFKEGMGPWTPYRWNFVRDYTAAVAENYFYTPERVSEDTVQEAIQMMEGVARAHSQDAFNHYVLVDMYNEVSDVNPSEYLPKAEQEAKRALELSPNRQQVYFSLAKTKLLEGDKAEALRLVKYGLDLNQNVRDGHFYYGLLLSDAGEIAQGYEELQKAIELGRQWKNYHETQIVANFFADAGHLDEAAKLYELSLSMESDNPEARIKLGIVYYLLGNRELARQYIGEVASQFDLEQSPSYPSLKPILDDLGIAP